MVTVTTPPVERARSIFDDLGYTVSGDGRTFDAERKWRSVRVTAVGEPGETPTTGELRCFVTWKEHSRELERRLRRSDPEYEWAIISVSDAATDYEVIRQSSS